MNKRNIVYLIFLVLTIVLSLFGWLSLKNLLFNSSPPLGVLVVALIFLLLGAVLGLIFLFFNSLSLLVLAPALSFTSALLFFGIKPIYLIVFAIGVGLIVLAANQTLKEKNIHIKILSSEITRPALGVIFTIFALIISAVIYFSPPVQNISVELKVPRSLFDVVLNSMTGIVQKEIIPLNKVIDQSTGDKLYQTVNNQINFFLQPYKRYLPYGLAIAVFISLKAVSFIFVWIAIGLVGLVFSGMKKIGWVNIKKEMVEKETLEF